jgi:hypothetical protein
MDPKLFMGKFSFGFPMIESKTFFWCGPSHLQHLSFPPYLVEYDVEPPNSYLVPFPFWNIVLLGWPFGCWIDGVKKLFGVFLLNPNVIMRSSIMFISIHSNN